MSVHVCPVHGCESLILPSRFLCHGHLMSLPALNRYELSWAQMEEPCSDRLRYEQAAAVAYLNGLQPRGRAS